MKINRIILYISAGFIIGTFFLIGMQSVTSKNVKGLISGNENLLKDFNISDQLAKLQHDILVYDNKLKNVVITGNSNSENKLSRAETLIKADLFSLQKIKANPTLEKFIDDLDSLVHQKLIFNKEVINNFNNGGKAAAENLFSTQKGNNLSESIALLTEKNDIFRQQSLADATEKVDSNGQQALLWGTLIIAVVLILFIFVFWFIINRMRRQNSLINELNIKEEKLKDALKIKEKFLANMSHEIRTPMTAIMGYTALLQKRELDGETKLFVSTIQKAGENLMSIINDILDLSKIEAGMMRIEEVSFSIRELVQTVNDIISQKIKEKGLSLKIYIESRIPDYLLGDPTRLTQVLINLMGNAIKFTQQGEILLNINKEKSENGFIYITFKIKDTGIGIEREKIETVFERFSQAEDSTTRKYGGTGLGLSIVKEIVYLQKGDIKVESEFGVGTSFMFTIPYKVAMIQNLPASLEENMSKEYFNSEINILVVEDNKINRNLLEYILKQWGLNYALATNGKEAIQLLKKQHFDIVLMDIQMPEMDGYTATREIKETLKLDIPVIAMTAHTMDGEKEKCISCGMNGHLSKPIMENELYETIARFANLSPFAKPVLNLSNELKVYKTIDLNYLKEISNDDKCYEKTVTEQFITLLPEEILLLKNAFEVENHTALKNIAHNMKTSISIMGLNKLLDNELDAIENNQLSKEELETTIKIIVVHLDKAILEANSFFNTL